MSRHVFASLKVAAVKIRCMPLLGSSRSVCISHPLFGRWKKGQFIIWKPWKGDRSNDVVKIPDWSYADGRPAPPGTNMTVNMELQKQICKRIILLRKEMAIAKETATLHNEAEK